MLQFSAEVTDIRLESRIAGKNRWQLALDRTAFYPESGGQPWNLGTLEAVAPSGARLSVPVLEVLEEAGEVWHVVEKPVSAGTTVTGAIDSGRRRDHMQQHTGQHLLSAVFLRQAQAATISFHLGSETSTIDLAIPELNRQVLLYVERSTNELVADDRPVTVSTVPPPEAEAMLTRGDLRKLPDREGPIRVIEIQGVEWNVCGGTHVASTGRIGGITLRRIERVKGGLRIEFCCGLRTVRAARADFDQLAEVSRLLSSGPYELAAKVAGMIEDARASLKERRALLDEVAALEARTVAVPGKLTVSSARNLDYAKLLAAKIARLGGIALVIALEQDRATAVLAGDGLDCNAVMKAALATCGGRGGGSPGMAQGTVSVADLDRLRAEIVTRAG